MRRSRIALQLWISAAILRVLKRFVPLETLVRMMHRTPARKNEGQSVLQPLESYMAMSGRFPFRPPANCLERSLGAYRLLCAADAKPELVIGVRRAEDQGVRGHVWLTVAGRPFAERDGREASYVPLVVFDSDAQRHASRASGDLPDGIL